MQPGGDAFVDVLARTAFVVTGVLTRIAAEYDVSLTQMRVLGVLRDRRPRMAQLADLLGLDKSTMSGLIDRAEQRGLVARARNADDARAIDVCMTAAGVELAAPPTRTSAAPCSRSPSGSVSTIGAR